MIGEIAKQVIIQMTLQAVDRMLSANAEAADNVGLETRISRTYDGKGLSGGRVCEWCLERECDELPYEEAKAQGAFERHPGCGCVIVYDHGDGVVDIAGRNASMSTDVRVAASAAAAILRRRAGYGLAGVRGPAKSRLAAAVARRMM